MQPGDNLIDPAGTGHGVLSHRPGEHLQNLGHGDGAPFDETNEQAHIEEDPTGPRGGLGGGNRGGERGRQAASGVEPALLELAGLVAVVGAAALVGLAPAVGLAAAEGTAQIASTGIARVAEKEDPTVPTAGQAPSQPGIHAQHRSQQPAIRQDQTGDEAVPIPIRGELKVLPDLDGKKPRLWLWIPTLVKHPLRYRNGSPLSRWCKGNSFCTPATRLR